MIQGPKLSIVIPVKGSEPRLESLLEVLESQLELNHLSFEIIVSLAPGSIANLETHHKTVQVLSAPTIGRCHQFNFAAQNAKGEWILFLHADSKLFPESIVKLSELISSPQEKDKSIFYFWLQFSSDGPWACWLNARLANLRSKYLGLPFGDQGFLLKREWFSRLGAFPSHFKSGEDHAFVQIAKKSGFSIKPIDAWIQTSARRYKHSGWARLTAMHLFLTAKQEFLPEDKR